MLEPTPSSTKTNAVQNRSRGSLAFALELVAHVAPIRKATPVTINATPKGAGPRGFGAEDHKSQFIQLALAAASPEAQSAR